ncbi:MAG TPA: molybdopterin-dependent oxidoreductase [Thermoanaerobaculia bacterium]|nr:molybdopterin-dependent oxidoreductase [Thermoanaerobaculia bacterium]
MTIGRREFIGIMAGGAAGIAAGFPAGRLFSNALSSANQTIYPPRGPQELVLSVCGACPGGCGVRARKIGGRVVKVDGNPLHPISGGRLCPKGQAAVQALYHPDRIKTPLRRTGARGSLSSFKPATWDEALNDIGARLKAVRDEQRPEAVVLLRGPTGDGHLQLARQFLDAYGSPNDIAFDRRAEAASMAVLLTQGVRAVPAPDIRGADYILSLGNEMLEASAAPVFTMRAYGDFRQSHAARRGKLVHVDPRLSISAASADEWISIRPGTHATFALGIAAAMVAEELYDKDFVADHGNGFDNLQPILARHFPLEKVAADTGVSVNVLLRVARELAGARRGLVLPPDKGPLLGGRLYDHLAVHILNALAGNIDQPGGVLLTDDVDFDAPPPAHDAIASAGHRRPRMDGVDGQSMLAGDPEQLAQALATGQPYRAEVLFVTGADPLYASSRTRFAAALERVPMTVVFASLATDTALHADWILPETHALEQWSLRGAPAAVPFPIVSLGSPALAKPVVDARPLGDVFLALGKRAGIAFKWDDSKAAIRAAVDRLYEAKRGAVMGTDFEAAWVRMMEEAGWRAPGYSTSEELWNRSIETGGWWDPFYDHGDWGRVLPKGHFDFRPDLIKQFAESATPRLDGGGALALILFEPLPVAGGSGAELPFLQALLDPGHEERWATWGEIHPQTARALHLRDGARIRVATGNDAIVVHARVTERIVPGAIAIPAGLGKSAGGRWAEGIGANPLRLLDSAREPFSLLPDFGAANVLVSEATS